MRKILLFIFISTSFLFTSNETFAQNRTEKSRAVEAVKVFYRFHFSHKDAFDERGVSRRRRLFTPKLRQLFDAELKRQKIYLKKYPDNKPYFEGLPFEPIEFCPNDYRVGAAQTTRQTATAKVNFVYSKSSCDASDGTKISYKILLSKITGKWLINDVIYDDGSTLTKAFSEAQKIK
ncbi:MAG: hypothetical protein H0U50_04820 [Pyrinomonadaceae bacterium]|nr:hypothetical protein [Pyrinomonadaceae bacterium]